MQINDLNSQNKLLRSIINHSLDGIVVLDGHKKIHYFNKCALKIFEVSEHYDISNAFFMDVVRNNTINLNIERCIKEKCNFIEELNYFNGEQQKNLKIFFYPSDHVTPPGCIIYVSDNTNIKKLEHVRSQFVSNVTHELKTPLTSIRGFIETLRNGAIKDTNVVNSFLDIIDIESERLFMLINDILHLSEIEHKLSDDNIKRQNILPIVQETLGFLSPVAAKKNISLQYDIDPKISLEINSYRLKQLLINLVDNGIKYNKNNGFVKVFCFESQGKLTIAVEDSGIGIPKKHHNRIFERFYTVDKSRSRRLGGTGLGLSIIKHIVNLYNGNIYFTSAIDKGTTFVIEFPTIKST
jgi:two-component system phosphate regulon sensor histidine kinase PhoR